MERKLKICCGCELPKVIWKAHKGCKYCQNCWQKQTPTTKIIKPRQQIAPRSEKRVKQDAEYSIKRKAYLEKYPMCQIHISGICTTYSTDIHHTHAGGDRDKYYLEESTWKGTCRMCHGWVHTHPKESRELGLLN